MSAAPQTASKKWLWLAVAFGGLGLIVLVSLGTWQVKRLAWKEDLLRTIDLRTTQEPVQLAEFLAQSLDADAIEYTPVATTGVFDHSNEQHFFATFDGLSGYYIYAPLKLQDGRSIFINRGFVPFDKKDASTRPESLVQGQQDVTGLARSVPEAKAGWVVPENDTAKNVFHWKDLDAMIARTGEPADNFVRLFIDQDDTANPGQLPVGGVTIIDLPNNHLQYAITWYGLALTLLGVLGFYLFRQRASK